MEVIMDENVVIKEEADIENIEKTVIEEVTPTEEDNKVNNIEADAEKKPLANVIDLLLAKDLSEFKVKSKEIEITRLSEIFGAPFVIELRIIPVAIARKIEEDAYEFSVDEDGNPDIDIKSEQEMVNKLVEACYTKEGEQIFKNAMLRKHFNARSNDVLVRKMLLPGEISKIYSRYRKLSGNIKTSIKDIKN